MSVSRARVSFRRVSRRARSDPAALPSHSCRRHPKLPEVPSSSTGRSPGLVRRASEPRRVRASVRGASFRAPSFRLPLLASRPSLLELTSFPFYPPPLLTGLLSPSSPVLALPYFSSALSSPVFVFSFPNSSFPPSQLCCLSPSLASLLRTRPHVSPPISCITEQTLSLPLVPILVTRLLYVPHLVTSCRNLHYKARTSRPYSNPPPCIVFVFGLKSKNPL